MKLTGLAGFYACFGRRENTIRQKRKDYLAEQAICASTKREEKKSAKEIKSLLEHCIWPPSLLDTRYMIRRSRDCLVGLAFDTKRKEAEMQTIIPTHKCRKHWHGSVLVIKHEEHPLSTEVKEETVLVLMDEKDHNLIRACSRSSA